MISAIEKLQDGTIKLTLTIPFSDVTKTKEEVIGLFVAESELPGFRKGKAPKKLVEEKIDQEKVREEILKRLLPKAYSEAVKDHNLRPIINPQIHIHQIEESKDWIFVALTCEAPEINLGNYKDEIKKLTAKSKIIVPDREPFDKLRARPFDKAQGKQEVNFDEIVKELLTNATVKIPKIIVDQETDRLLAQTLDEVKKLGLTLEQYLSSTQRTPQDLRAEYVKKAEDDIKLEFVLQKVAQDEKISVSEKEIDEAIQKAKDENERKNLEANRYLLASILRQQKTLDFLRNL
ncbi:MAG: hypothetical protein M1268_02260 [Patescibacteria group bacterium]|nr:hypothetical protein [Patescibacteria group bacterium]